MAHLSDLSRDQSDNKFADMNFMEKLVDKNFLELKWKEKIVNVQLATPIEVFDRMNHEVIDELENLNIFNFLKEDKNLYPKEFSSLLDVFRELLDTKVEKIGNFDEDIIKDYPFLSKLIPKVNRESTFLELIENVSKLPVNMYKDNSIWRELRKYSIDNLKLQKIDITKDDFNENLKETYLNQTFLEYVEQQFSFNESLKEQYEYNYHVLGYDTLNVLGIDKEKNRGIKFANVQDDAQHSYYAAHCDYFIVEDKGLAMKSKVLYKLFNIKTKVLTIEEFSQKILTIIEKSNNFYLGNFTEFLKNDLKKGKISKERTNLMLKRRFIEYQVDLYFDFFDRIDFIDDLYDGRFLVFHKDESNYSRFYSYTEIEKITNKIVKVLGRDSLDREFFISGDIARLKEKDREIRCWNFFDNMIILEINKGTGKLNLLYYLKG